MYVARRVPCTSWSVVDDYQTRVALGEGDFHCLHALGEVEVLIKLVDELV